MKLKSPLVGEHLLLRTLGVEDATPRYLSWLSDEDVVRHLEIRFSVPGTVNELARFIAATVDSDDTLMLGMFLRADGRHIGNIKLGPINLHHSTGDIGLLIGERGEWGKGHAHTAITLLADYAFNKLGVAKLTAGCYSENEGSRRAFLKAGFAEEGRRAAQYLLDGKRQACVLLGKVNPALELCNP